MIFHLLRQDVKINWFTYLLVLSFVVLFHGILTDQADSFQFSMMVCFAFGMGFDRQIIGVKYRSQNSMSRNYLLALPVKRSKMFYLLLIRSLVFAIPIYMLLLTQPFLNGLFSKFSEPLGFIAYAFSTAATLVAFKIVTFDSFLRWETVPVETDRKRRVFLAIMSYLIFTIQMAAIGTGFVFYVFSKKDWAVVVPLALSVVVGVSTYLWARKTWSGR